MEKNSFTSGFAAGETATSEQASDDGRSNRPRLPGASRTNRGAVEHMDRLGVKRRC